MLTAVFLFFSFFYFWSGADLSWGMAVSIFDCFDCDLLWFIWWRWFFLGSSRHFCIVECISVIPQAIRSNLLSFSNKTRDRKKQKSRKNALFFFFFSRFLFFLFSLFGSKEATSRKKTGDGTKQWRPETGRDRDRDEEVIKMSWRSFILGRSFCCKPQLAVFFYATESLDDGKKLMARQFTVE